MLRPLILVPILLFLAACGQNNVEQGSASATDTTVTDTVAVLNDPENNLNIQTNGYSEIDSSGILMFPLSLPQSEGSRGSFSYSSSSSPNSFWNIIFLNGKTNEYYLLSEGKMLIRNYDLTDSRGDYGSIAQTKLHIFYIITSNDHNRDNKLTEDDPQYLFVSDKEGKAFRQLSPASCTVLSWQFVRSLNKVLMTVKKDSDKNNKFDDGDETGTFEVDMERGTEAVEIFSTDFKNKLKLLYDRDWKEQEN